MSEKLKEAIEKAIKFNQNRPKGTKKIKVPNCSCAQCGEPKYKKPSKLKEHPLTFCNKDCHINYKLKDGFVNCDECQSIIHRNNRQLSINKKNFCNHNCRALHQKTGRVVTCRFCENNIYKTEGKIKKYNNFYCNQLCMNKDVKKYKFSKTGKRNTSLDRKNKEILISKNGYICQNKECICRKNNIILDKCLYDLDHIDENHSNNHESNLQLLCVLCHKIKTKKRKK